MGALTVQNIVDAGTKPNFALNTPTTSDTVTIGSGHNTFLVYKNASGSPQNVTFASHYILDNGDVAGNHVVVLPATTGEIWVPLRKSYDDGTGNATVTMVSATSITVAAVLMS